MKCQKCNKNEANTHITKVINGVKTEEYLCSACAGESQELMNFKTSFDHEFDNFFSGFFANPFLGGTAPAKSIGSERRCSSCGTTLDDVERHGRLGCSDCYRSFADFLLNPLKQIHGANRHTGKLPQRAGRGLRKASRIESLESDLNRAVMDQNFEKAAELRDKIKELRNQQ